MELITLVDNVCGHPDLVSEHGLSILIKINGRHLLCDMGRSSAFIDNAVSLGMDLRKVDFAVLSHGHNDHSGGLPHFLEINSAAKLYLSPDVFNERYFSTRHGDCREISIDVDACKPYLDRMVMVEDSCWLSDDIALVRTQNRNFPTPKGNNFLFTRVGEALHKDDFSHELALAIKTGRELVVISPCSHCGAINIMNSCREFTAVEKVRAFVGGLHFVDCNATQREVSQFIQDLNDNYPDTEIYTGHCTCDRAKQLLSASSPHIHIFSTGSVISF